MADADSDLENEFSINIFSPIDPRFNNYCAFNTRTLNEPGNRTVTPENTFLHDSHSFDSRNTVAEDDRRRFDRQSSIVDGLLSEIYLHWQDHRHDSFDSDTFTECSSTSEFVHWRRHSVHLQIAGRQLGYLHRGILQEYGFKDLKNLWTEISRHVSQMSVRLVRQLKRRERRMSKMQNNCDIVTAIIQASSPKRRIDTRMRFSVEPCGGDSAFEQWKDAMKAVARLPLGIPAEFRKKVWLSLAEQHIKDMKIDWEKTIKFAFNERSNPDDNKLGVQIVKDLHRTGCSGFSGEENEEERALLKRILLAYARWNKVVGYCQGFNMIAALLLDVMDRKESDALKVMIYLIDHVLPQGYFANNLRALSVDMAVFRDLLKIFPKLSRHLDYLQHAQDQTSGLKCLSLRLHSYSNIIQQLSLEQSSGGCYEPPLTNVFTMQWFLTLFATCLPKSTVLRVWDSILLDGSEILLRTALVIWGKLSSRILTVSSADEFYTLMGDITQEMLEGNILDADSMIKSIYCIAPFPLPQLTELREKYTYNIRPFTPASKKASWPEGAVVHSDEDDLEEDDLENITCFTGFIPTNVTTGVKHHKGLEGDQRTGSLPDISSLGPGAYGMGPADGSGVPNIPAYMERMSTDISALKKQYTKLRQRQNQAHIILTSATAKHQAMKSKPMMPRIETPTAMNHLFLHKHNIKGRNRYIAEGPRIANVYPVLEPRALSKLQRQAKTKSAQTSGDNKQKWNQKTKTDMNTEGISSSNQSHIQIKTDTEADNQLQSSTGVSVTTQALDNDFQSSLDGSAPAQETKTESMQEPEESSNCDMHENTDTEDKIELDVSDSQLSDKCDHTTLQHNDSGLGYSLSSPLFSSSSTESSPQHSSVAVMVEDMHMTKLDGSACSEMSTLVVNTEIYATKCLVNDEEDYSGNCDNHISDLTNLVKEICEAQFTDGPNSDKEFETGFKLKHNDSAFNESSTECDAYIKTDPFNCKSDDNVSECDTDIKNVVCDNDDVSIDVEAGCDSEPKTSAIPGEAATVGTIDNNILVDTEKIIPEGANVVKDCDDKLKMPFHIKDTCNASESELNETIIATQLKNKTTTMSTNRTFMSEGTFSQEEKDRLTLTSSNMTQMCSNSTFTSKSASRSDSSCFVACMESGDDSDPNLEVVSSSSTMGQASDSTSEVVSSSSTMGQASDSTSEVVSSSSTMGQASDSTSEVVSPSSTMGQASDSTSEVVSPSSTMGQASDSTSEVVSPSSTSGQASFQQYYINKKNLSTESVKGLEAQRKKTQLPKKVFNPFPVKHINQNRARTGIKLGLYKPSTLQEYERSLKVLPLWGK